MKAFAAVLLLCFILLGLVGLHHHELWRDEMQGWLIASDSASIAELMHNQRYETGRSFFSFLGFWAVSRLSRSPIAMQLFHLALAATTVYLVARFSPFTRLQKVAIAFSYFFLFEYSLICRDYAIGVLLVVLFCVLFQLQRRRYILLTACLVLVANTNFYALVVALSLGFPLFILHPPRQRDTHRSDNWQHWAKRLVSIAVSGDFAVSLLIGLLGVAIALYFMLPPADGTITPQTPKPFSLGHFASTLAIVWKSYAPMPGIAYHFWNTNILDDGIAAVLSVGLLLLAIDRFICQPVLLASYLFGTCSILYLTYAKFPGTMRHWGYLFILFFACLWLSHRIPAASSRRLLGEFLGRYQPQVLNILLSIQLAAGVFAYSSDLLHPFSQAKAAADAIQTQPGKPFIVGDPDWAALPVAGYLNQPIYYPASGGFGTFIRFNQSRHDLSPDRLVAQVRQLASTTSNLLLVLNYPLKLDAAELAQFTGAIVQDENYYLYTSYRPDRR